MIFRNPFLIYNFKGFPISCVCHICKSLSSGYNSAISSSFKHCIHFGKKKHLIGKVWVKWTFFSPCWYWGLDWNKHALSWKPNHMKKGASWGGRSSTNSAVGIGIDGSRYHRSQISTLPLCWEPAPHSFTLILVSSCKYRQHQFIHRDVTEPRRQKVHCMLAVRWRWYRPQEVALLLACLLTL